MDDDDVPLIHASHPDPTVATLTDARLPAFESPDLKESFVVLGQVKSSLMHALSELSKVATTIKATLPQLVPLLEASTPSDLTKSLQEFSNLTLTLTNSTEWKKSHSAILQQLRKLQQLTLIQLGRLQLEPQLLSQSLTSKSTPASPPPFTRSMPTSTTSRVSKRSRTRSPPPSRSNRSRTESVS